MVDYSKAKIYKVLNDVDDDVYIGATCQALSMRMVGHRKARTSTKHKNYKLYRKMNEIEVEHFYIELIKETPCDNKEQLRAIEGEYIRKYGTLNSRIEDRTKEEWNEKYKETKKEQSKIRYVENREEILEKQKNERLENPEKKREISRKSYQTNKEKRLAKNKERIECVICGKELSRDYMRKHIKAIHS